MADIININNENEEVKNEQLVVETKTETEVQEQKHKENGITIDKLIDGYLKRTSTKMKEEYLKAVIKVKPYASYGVKIFLADTIIKTSCLKDGKVHIDSCKKYMLYLFALIDTYTNIEINQKEWTFEYDRLDSLGLIESILGLIPEKEIATFKTILDMKMDDLMTNRYGTHAFVEEQMDRLSAITSELNKAFAPLMDKLIEKIDTIDENKVEKMLSRVSKLVKK